MTKNLVLKALALCTIIVVVAMITQRQQPSPAAPKPRHRDLTARALINPVKVFQIGFSKCGTATLHSFFTANGVASIHNDFGRLALSIYNNANANKPLLSRVYSDYYVFTDMERMFGDPPIYVGMMYLKQLDEQYPGSKFILNTRDKEAWVKSKSIHVANKHNKLNILEAHQRTYKLSKHQVVDQWSREWDDHHRAVKEYFKDRPNDLLVFNIETDPPEKLVEFFKENFALDPKLYVHKNKTLPR